MWMAINALVFTDASRLMLSIFSGIMPGKDDVELTHQTGSIFVSALFVQHTNLPLLRSLASKIDSLTS
jgi:hypothetical protein